MAHSKTHSFWKNGNLVFYEHGKRHRWLDAVGPNVVKFEVMTGEPIQTETYSSLSTLTYRTPQDGGLARYQTVVTSSSDASAAITNATSAPYRLKFSTKSSDAKYAMLQTQGFPFKLENSMPLYFGCKVKINSATSTDFIGGLLQNKSGTILASHNIAASTDGVYFIKLDTATAVTPTCESGGNTSTTSTKTMTTSAHVFEFVWNGSGSSTAVDFYASGTHLGQVTSKIDQTADLGFSMGIGCGKSAHQTLSVEWARVIQLRT